MERPVNSLVQASFLVGLCFFRSCPFVRDEAESERLSASVSTVIKLIYEG
jgi:hypothetical protein